MNDLETEFCSVKYIKEENAVLLTWKKFACGKNYQNPTTYARKMFEETGAKSYIVDARNGFEDEKEDVEWVISVLLPGMAKTSCKTVCFIMNEVNEIEAEMDFWTKEFSKYFKVVKATTFEMALRKLQ